MAARHGSPVIETRRVMAKDGFVEGGVRRLLRGEGLALLGCAAAAYWRVGGDWKQFAILFLVPDLSFLGYLFGARTGAAAYNTMHATILPLALGAFGVALANPPAIQLALIWLAHVGFDRALGYGLKYGSGFGVTHLGRIGRRQTQRVEA
jgi:uncharacterized protein DUF4260